jgi:hypothetical protein
MPVGLGGHVVEWGYCRECSWSENEITWRRRGVGWTVDKYQGDWLPVVEFADGLTIKRGRVLKPKLAPKPRYRRPDPPARVDGPFFKLVRADGTTSQGFGQWVLPTDGRPGVWQSARSPGKPRPCTDTAIHLLQSEQVDRWLQRGDYLYRAETQYPTYSDWPDNYPATKVVTRKARLVECVAEPWPRLEAAPNPV